MNTHLRRPLHLLSAYCLAVASLTASAAGTVNVSFVQPERFTDADRGWQRDRNLESLSKHLQALGRRELADGETLDIQVLDVDLAGDIDPFAVSGRDLRVLKGGADWPRITLRYALSRNGQPVSSAEERLADLNYLQDNIRPLNASQQPLSHEKHMLDDWFAARFAPQKVGSR